MTRERSTRVLENISILKNVANSPKHAALKEEFIFGDIFMKKSSKKK